MKKTIIENLLAVALLSSSAICLFSSFIGIRSITIASIVVMCITFALIKATAPKKRGYRR